MASREELLQSIRPGVILDQAFFLKVYGYEITTPGFAEKALSALELVAGCTDARKGYSETVERYEESYQEQMKEVGRWYAKWCAEKQKGGEGTWTIRKNSQQRLKQNLSEIERRDNELRLLLKKLRSGEPY